MRAPAPRLCAAASEAQEKTQRERERERDAARTIASVVVEPDLRLGLHAHHDAEGAANHAEHQRLHRHIVRPLRRLLLVLLRSLGLVEDVAGRDGGRAARPDRHSGALQLTSRCGADNAARAAISLASSRATGHRPPALSVCGVEQHPLLGGCRLSSACLMSSGELLLCCSRSRSCSGLR